MGDIDQLILLDRMKRIEQRKDDARALEFFLLHSDKININTQDSLGQTPLIIACKLGREEVVQFLLGCPNLDVNIADDVYRNTALLTACSFGYEAIVTMLLGHKQIQVNMGDLGMDTPLMIACTMPHLGVVKLLLNNDELNINDQNIGGYTALMSILTEKDNADTAIIRSLLDHKDIDINFTLPQEYGYKNALTMACDIGQTEVISMLLQRDEIHTTAGNLNAVSDFVMNYEDFLSGQAFVMNRGRIDIKDVRDMRTVIEEAVSKNLPDIARWLVKTQGFLLRACTPTSTFCMSKRRCKRSEKLMYM